MSSRKIALFYIEKKCIKNYNDVIHNKLLRKLTKMVSGYFATLTNKGYKEKGDRLFIRTDEIIKGLNDLLEGKKKMNYCYKKFESRANMDLNIEWRNLKDIDKDETLWFNDKPDVKMCFLGIIKETDPHFKELFENGSKDYSMKKRRKKIRMSEEEILIKYTINYFLKYNLFSFRKLANKYIDKLMDFNSNLSRKEYSKNLTCKFKKLIMDSNIELFKIYKSGNDNFYETDVKIINSLKEKLKEI